MDDADQQNFLEDLDYDLWAMLKRKPAAEVTDTSDVPRLDDAALTYPAPGRDEPNKVKRLSTCVLYVDIRDSSQLTAAQRPQRLARVYAAFVYAMVTCARRAGGHVRNIIGDRVMVVFDPVDCFAGAFEAARLCNTAAQRMLHHRVKQFDFRCGIGVDYGTMLVVKAGVPRRGGEAEFYRSLVWLGRPANVASKLTDVAGKRVEASGGETSPTAHGAGLTPAVYPPVLITSTVLEGLRDDLGEDDPACAGWTTQPIEVPGFGGRVYGADPLLAV